eukprot:2722940-Rhodomonas_salina.1
MVGCRNRQEVWCDASEGSANELSCYACSYHLSGCVVQAPILCQLLGSMHLGIWQRGTCAQHRSRQPISRFHALAVHQCIGQ